MRPENDNPFEIASSSLPDFQHTPPAPPIKTTSKGNIKIDSFQKSDYSSDKKWPRQIIRGLPPSKSNSYKIITFKSKDPSKPPHSSLAKASKLLEYEKLFYMQCSHYRNAGIDSYFELEMDVFYPNQRSDLDGCLKVVLDCLQHNGAIKNDNKCVKLLISKYLDKHNPRIEFVIKPVM